MSLSKMHFGVALVLTGSAVTAVPAGGAVVISEFMYEAAGSDDNREWVEIYNTGGSAVDIGGWGIHDEDAGSLPAALIPAGTSLAPGQSLVLIETESTFLADWGTGINYLVYPGMGTTLNMANTGTAVGDEVLQLRDAAGNLVDAVDYMNSSPFPDVTNATATAIYVLPGQLDATLNDSGGSWARATEGVDGARLAAGRIDAGSPGLVVVPEPGTALAGIAVAGFVALSGGRRRRI